MCGEGDGWAVEHKAGRREVRAIVELGDDRVGELLVHGRHDLPGNVHACSFTRIPKKTIYLVLIICENVKNDMFYMLIQSL